MPQPVSALTDPVGFEDYGQRAYPLGTSTPYAAGRASVSTRLAQFLVGTQLVSLSSGVSARTTATIVGNPGAPDRLASAVVTFPAIYKPYRPAANPGVTTYPPMRVYPPIIVN